MFSLEDQPVLWFRNFDFIVEFSTISGVVFPRYWLYYVSVALFCIRQKYFFATFSEFGQFIARMNIHVFRRLMSAVSTKTSNVTSSQKSDSIAVFRRFQIDSFCSINFIMYASLPLWNMESMWRLGNKIWMKIVPRCIFAMLCVYTYF